MKLLFLVSFMLFLVSNKVLAQFAFDSKLSAKINELKVIHTEDAAFQTCVSELKYYMDGVFASCFSNNFNVNNCRRFQRTDGSPTNITSLIGTNTELYEFEIKPEEGTDSVRQLTRYHIIVQFTPGSHFYYMAGGSCFAYKKELDLSLGPISILGAKPDTNDGLPIVSVGTSTQINVPISVSFTTPPTPEVLNTLVPVTLQVGAQTLKQNISIATLVENKNNNNKIVPFMVTFQPTDIGLKTLIATVNPGNILKETNYTNNEARQQVHVVGRYRIVKEVSVGAVSYGEGPVAIAPSKLAGCNSSKDIKRVNIKITCLRKLDNGSEETVANCKLNSKLSWLDRGPHDHDDGSTEHLGKLIQSSEEIPITGLNLTYEVSEFAGEYAINLEPRDPNGQSFAASPITVRASIEQDLTPLNDLLAFDITSHPGDGYYATPLLRDRLSIALAQYRAEVSKLNKFLEQIMRGPAGEPDPLLDEIGLVEVESEGASLSWGGAFDIRRNWKADSSLWKTVINSDGKPVNLYNGHCLHRNGQHLDISMSPFDKISNEELKREYKFRLNKAFIESELHFPVEKESIRSKAKKEPDHWHAQPQ